MRALIFLAALLVLFALVGWITFRNEPGRPGIHLETDEIRQDTGEMMQSGSNLLRDAEEESTEGRPAVEPSPALK